jgi:Uma2 family endonuclease
MQLVFPDTEDLVVIPNPLMDDDQFFEFCVQNPDVQIERTAQGEIEIMPPAGGETGSQNGLITAYLILWAVADGRGVAFDSSTGFILPNAAVRSPDSAWVRKSWLDKLTKGRKRRHLPLAPDFIIELMSPSDRRSRVVATMQELIDNGVELAWMIDPDQRTVTIYRPGRDPEQLVDPEFVDGEGPVGGFRLEMARIWAGI